ncbi:MAG: class I mannose-6-phosphate isomerase [Clostridia bacterium]|nr:class I mannose-6-phosphate isomerase [Clostridia bacterium]
MKPLKLKAAYKDYIWGGEKLRKKYGKETDMTPLAESWELSCHPDGLSIIDSEEYKGKTLLEYIEENEGCLGTLCKSNELPILIKLIDAQDNLSVQVHPDDKMAKELEGQNGKTEMWYVVEADKGAKMTCGVKKDITKEILEKAIKNNTVEELLNTVPSEKGDVFFVEAGTIHAIGKGNVIAEIQQNSNVTYRLYDYGRIGKDGQPRELHIEKGVKAANCRKNKLREMPVCSDDTRILGSCEYFTVKEIKLSGSKSFVADEKSYHAIVVVDGEAEIKTKDDAERIYLGETVFVPANMGEYVLTGKATILLTTNQNNWYVGFDV